MPPPTPTRRDSKLALTSTPLAAAAPAALPAALFTPAAVVHLEVAAFALVALLGGQAVRNGVLGGLPVPAGSASLPSALVESALVESAAAGAVAAGAAASARGRTGRGRTGRGGQAGGGPGRGGKAGGAAGARGQTGRGGKARGRTGGGGKATSAKVKMLKGGWAAGGAGDSSRSWRWPWTAGLDSAALALPTRIAPVSPLLARVLVDGSYLRAIFGSLSLLLPAAGLLLGGLALHDTGGLSAPPAAALLTGIAVLGVFDALAGFLAVAVFVVGTAAAGGLTSAAASGGLTSAAASGGLTSAAASGGLDSPAAIRTMLGLGVIWFAVPLIAGAARPLRRLAGRGIADRRKRLADLVIASLIGAWAIQKMIMALPGLAGRPLPIARDAGRIALLVLGVAVLRIGLESIAARFYPMRLAAVQPASVPRSQPPQRIAAAAVRTAVFLFVALAFLGDHWQLWVGGALFLMPQLLSIYEQRFANSTRLYRWLPRGLLKLVLMLFVGTAFGAFALHLLAHSRHAALDAFVLLAMPGVAFSALELFGREGAEPEEGWGRWLAGAGVLVIGVLVVQGKLL